jgi:uncharacterized damage-inducible protein DinB
MSMNLEYLVSHWASVRSGLLETVGKFREDELEFRPFATSWSARQTILHIAQEEHGEFSYGILRVLETFPGEYDPRDYRNKASLIALLESVHAQTLIYTESLIEDDLGRMIQTPWGKSYRLIEMLGHLVEHEIHHRAELSLMLGMLGHEGFDA